MFADEDTHRGPARNVLAAAWADFLCRLVRRSSKFVSLDYRYDRSLAHALRDLLAYLWRAVLVAGAADVAAVPFADRTLEGRVHWHVFVDGLPRDALLALWRHGRVDVSDAHGRKARLYIGSKEARADDADPDGEGFIGVHDGRSVAQAMIVGALEDAEGEQSIMQLALRLSVSVRDWGGGRRTYAPDADLLLKNLRRLELSKRVRHTCRDGRELWRLG